MFCFVHPQTLTRRPCPGSQAVLFHPLDIASPGSVDAFAKWAAEELQHVDILVNNAGTQRASDAPQRAPPSLNRRHERDRRGAPCDCRAVLVARRSVKSGSGLV